MWTAIALHLVGCTHESEPPPVETPALDTAVTDTGPATTTPTDDCGGQFYDGRLTAQAVRATCDDEAHIRYALETRGWASHGEVYVVETGAEAPRVEDHVLASVEHDPCGSWDLLAQEVRIVTDDESSNDDETTHFGCAAWDDDALTLATTVYDLSGALADCILLGHDPIGLRDGAYDAALGPPLADLDLGACVVFNGFSSR